MFVNVTLKRDFVDVINLGILRLSRWALSAITNILNKREAEEDYTQKRMQCDQGGLVTWPQAKECHQPPEAGRGLILP